MAESALVDLLLWSAGVIGAAVALLPALMNSLGVNWLHYSCKEDPTAVAPVRGDPNLARRYEELKELGLQPLGIVKEYLWFSKMRWLKIFPVYCLGTADGKLFAGIYRLDEREPARFALDTFTTGGCMISTAMPGVGLEYKDDRLLRSECPEMPLAELLAHHRKHVEAFTQERGLSVVGETFAGRTSLSREHDSRLLASRSSPSNDWQLLGWFVLLWLGLLYAVIRVLDQPSLSRGLAVSLCLCSATYILIMRFMVRLILAEEFFKSLVRDRYKQNRKSREEDTEG